MEVVGLWISEKEIFQKTKPLKNVNSRLFWSRIIVDDASLVLAPVAIDTNNWNFCLSVIPVLLVIGGPNFVSVTGSHR